MDELKAYIKDRISYLQEEGREYDRFLKSKDSQEICWAMLSLRVKSEILSLERIQKELFMLTY